MTATYVLTNSIGKVRLYAQDTNTDEPAFEDEELQVFIDVAPSNNLRLAAAHALRSLAFDTARRGRWVEAKVSVDAAAEVAIKLAEWLEKQAGDVDGVSPTTGAYWIVAPWMAAQSRSAKETTVDDTDRVNPFFTRNVHKHPGALETAEDLDNE